MKFNDKYTANLIIKKSNIYLKNAILIFVLTIAVLGYGILFMVNYVQENNRNFTGNDSVHVLSVTAKTENNVSLELEGEDADNITDILSKYTTETEVITVYEFVGAVCSELGDEPVILLGIDREQSADLFDEQMEDNILYIAEQSMETCTLSLPVIEIDDNGNVTSGEVKEVVYDDVRSISMKAAFSLFRDRSEEFQEVYLTTETYFGLLQSVGGNADNIEEIFVYVDDMYQVEDCADTLTDEGYYVDYTFKAFDSLGSSLRNSLVFLSILVAALLATSSLNMILSFSSFFMMQQKDIGILKFYGFEEKRIYRMYCRNINLIFGGCAIFLSCFVAVIGWMILGAGQVRIMIALVVAVLILIVLLRVIVAQVCLKRIVKKEFLQLVRNSKSFE